MKGHTIRTHEPFHAGPPARTKQTATNSNNAPMQIPSRILGAMYYASTSPFVLPAVVARSSSPGPNCHELQAICLVQKNKKRSLIEVSPCLLTHTYIAGHHCIRHRHETWTACLCRSGEACRRSRPCRRPHRSPRGRRRQGSRPSGGEPEVGEHACEEIATKYSSFDERCGSNAERKAKKRDL